MSILLKRVYEDPSPKDGYRVLVDRLWPRGLSKDKAKLDQWMKDIAPSDGLRKWFHNNPSEWAEFRSRYLSELKHHRVDLRSLVTRALHGRVTLIFSSSDERHNNAVVLKQYLMMLGQG